jgi:hypothetical protein
MRRKRRQGSYWVALLGALAVLATGCVTYRNQSFWEVSKTKAEFEGANFRTLKLGIQASAECPYLFGIDLPNIVPGQLPGVMGIPMGDSNVLSQAMKGLHRQSDMVGKSCFLHNTNVEWTRRGLPFIYITQRVTITADVIEFDKEYFDYKPRP